MHLFSKVYIYIYSLLSQDYTFFYIYLSSGHSKHSRTPALICRFQMRLNKALFTEERERHEDLLSTFVHLNMQLYKLCKISQLKLLRLKSVAIVSHFISFHSVCNHYLELPSLLSHKCLLISRRFYATLRIYPLPLLLVSPFLRYNILYVCEPQTPKCILKFLYYSTST